MPILTRSCLFFYSWNIFYICSLFIIFITTMLVQLAIAFQKDLWNNLLTNFIHLKPLFFINTLYCIQLNISKERPLCWKNIHYQIMFSLNFKVLSCLFNLHSMTYLHTLNVPTKHSAQFPKNSLYFLTPQLISSFHSL